MMSHREIRARTSADAKLTMLDGRRKARIVSPR
jgi:hypothetical protein